MMGLREAPGLVIVKREEKTEKLKAFIQDILEREAAASGAAKLDVTASWTVIARSSDSPVVIALQALAQDLGPIGTRLVIAMPGRSEPSARIDLGDIARECRHLADPRHLNAHEQLILGPASCWVGDCMRREPAKRDAYEQYADDCSTTTGWAASAFERLWSAATPLASTVVPPRPPVAPVDMSVASQLAQPGEILPPTSTAATRH